MTKIQLWIMTSAFVVVAVPFATCVTPMQGYDGSATAIGHDFECNVPHFALYLASKLWAELLHNILILTRNS